MRCQLIWHLQQRQYHDILKRTLLHEVLLLTSEAEIRVVSEYVSTQQFVVDFKQRYFVVVERFEARVTRKAFDTKYSSYCVPSCAEKNVPTSLFNKKNVPDYLVINE